MKILVITSKAAKRMVEEVVKRVVSEDICIDILVLDRPQVAAAFTPKIILDEILKRKHNVRDYDYIMVPGLTIGDVSLIKEKTGVEAVKGPIHAIDIPLALKALLKGHKLSPLKPADEILRLELIDRIRSILTELKEETTIAIDYNGLRIPLRGPPIKLVAEIPPRQTIEEMLEIAYRYVEEGADIVIVGTGYNSRYDISKLIGVLSRKLNIPVGVDTDKPSEMIKAVESGASIVFSLNSSLIEKLVRYAKEAVYTIIPDKGYVNPWDIDSRITSLRENIERARKLGYDKIVADLVLSPVPLGFTPTLIAYAKAARLLKDTPIVLSASNVIEGLEVDTIGAIGLLAGIAVEIGASLFHIVEDSAYEYMSVGEAKIALTMNTIAYTMKTHARRVGLDLLVLKDREYTQTKPLPSQKTIEVESRREPILDPKGYFKINVIRNKAIELAYYTYNRDTTGKAIAKYVGTEALAIGRAMLKDITGLKPDHILYLGYELAKAEIALRLGKNYVQDKELFQTIDDKLRLVEKIENKDKDTKGSRN